MNSMTFIYNLTKNCEGRLSIFNLTNPHNFTSVAQVFEACRTDLLREKFVNKNFMHLRFVPSSLFMDHVEETEEYPLSRLLSDIGGCVGLWVGASLITVFEFIDLLLDLGEIVRYRAQAAAAFRQAYNSTSSSSGNFPGPAWPKPSRYSCENNPPPDDNRIKQQQQQHDVFYSQSHHALITNDDSSTYNHCFSQHNTPTATSAATEADTFSWLEEPAKCHGVFQPTSTSTAAEAPIVSLPYNHRGSRPFPPSSSSGNSRSNAYLSINTTATAPNEECCSSASSSSSGFDRQSLIAQTDIVMSV